MVTIVLVLFAGYLIGSIPFGKILCNFAGVDIQKRGSGNIGYANVLRIMGWKYAVPVLVLDVAKGAVAALIGLWIFDSSVSAFWVGYAAVIGHILPVWLGGKGGKGVATGLGVVMVLTPLAAALGVLAYSVGFHLLKAKSSNASMVAIVFMCITCVFLYPQLWWTGVLLLVTSLITLRQNILGRVPNYG